MWRKLPCNSSELNLDLTLAAGQSFRWSKNVKNEWQGVLCGLLWTLKQDPYGNILYSIYDKSTDISKHAETGRKNKRQKCMLNKYESIMTNNNTALNYEEILEDYFNLQLKLEDYYCLWGKSDNNFKEVSKNFKGIRILRQNPVENLISFICSANNNISRITSMVGDLCAHFGEKLFQIDEKSFHAFPTLERLANDDVEDKLRKLGFGYRAKYIFRTAQCLHKNKPVDWLENLRSIPYKEAHCELLKLPGVGAKVADCVCLMSLDKFEAVPVDTHIWQVTVRDYIPHLKSVKTLSNKIYQEIGDFYREKFGDYAGWATTILFAADLKKFKYRKE